MSPHLGLVALLAALGCAQPLAQGERRYQEGDRLGALEVWRQVPAGSTQHDSVQRRIAAVEAEFEQLVVRYKKRARYFEGKGRLAESALNYRLALKLQPDDRKTLDHLQQLVRRLDRERRQEHAAFAAAVERGDLPAARRHLTGLRTLDPFDPEYEIDAGRLEAALEVEVERLLARGRKRYRAGEYAEAERAFRVVLALDPENDTALGYRSLLASSRAAWAGGSSLAPPPLDASEAEIRAEGFYQNALAAERAGQPYAAIRHDIRALHFDSGHVEARRHLERLRRQLSGQVPELIESGRRHYQREELQSALDQWRRALLIQPENPEAQAYASRAEHLLQNLEQLRSEPTVGAR